MPVIASNGRHITLEDILPSLILEPDIHFCPTRLICLENTLQGMVFPQEEIVRISDFAREKGIAMHCDGARMWEVQAKTGKSLNELCAPFDTVSLCMSKGLGAPIGSVLVGPKAFIEKARWFRKMFGGGIRQSGGIAAAADYALTRTLPMLPRVHSLAAHLASSLQELGVSLLCPTETNMVWIDTTPLGFGVAELTRRALELDNGRRRLVLGGTRIVLHFQISDQAVEDIIELVKTMKDEAEKGLLKSSANGSNGTASPYDIKALKQALSGKGMIKKTGEAGVAYGGN
jgi:threonine aldolase